MRNSPVQRVWQTGALLALFAAQVSFAQFRAPPATEAQRLTFAGDDARAEAAEQLGKGNKDKANERYKYAITQYETALASNPEELAALAGIGYCANALGDHTRVVKRLTPFVERHPEDKELSYQLGLAHFKLKRYGDAVPLLERLQDDTDPAHLVVHYYLGYYYVLTQRGEQGVTALQKYLKLRPESLAGNDFQIYELMGRGYLAANRPVDARAALNTAQKGRPETLSIQMALEAVLELENKLPEARNFLESLAKKFPKAPEPKERLARLSLAAGDFNRADAVAQDLLKVDTGGSSQHLLGDLRVAQKRYPEAEAALRKATQALPNHMGVQVSLARALQAQNKNEEAIKLFETATQSGFNGVEAWAALGSIYRRAGRYQKAIESHQKVVEQAPKAAYGFVLLGADYYLTGQWDPAVDHYEKAVKLDPNYAVAKHWLAYSLSQRARQRADGGRISDAVRDLRRAMDLEPTPAMGRNLGAALLTLREYQEAAKVLDRAANLPGAAWQENLLLGYALLGAGTYKEAVDAFDRAGKYATEPEAVSQVYAGWALGKLELGEFDAAIQKLTEMANTGSAVKIVQGNLPFALLRRALSSLQRGDTAAAEKDYEAAKKMGSRDADANRLLALVRSLYAVEQRQYEEANRELKKTFAGKIAWAEPNAATLLDAYIDYRSGQTQAARKQLTAVKKKLSPASASWAATLGRAVDRREGELLYEKGSLIPSGKILKVASEADPLNPFIQHNLACLDHRAKKHADAVARWEDLVSAVPEAALNIGIDAQEVKKDYARAFNYYGKYLGRGTQARQTLAREWRDRLSAIYGYVDDKSEAPGERKVER